MHPAQPASPGCGSANSPTTREQAYARGIANFAAVPHEGYRIGLPYAGRWDEVLNTDADAYIGSGVGNFGGVEAQHEGWHGQPASAIIQVPPLGTVWLRHRPS